MAPKNSTEYSPVETDSEKAESSPFLSPLDEHERGGLRGKTSYFGQFKSLKRLALVVLPWFTTILFMFTTILGHRHKHMMPTIGTYEMGFATDMILPSHDRKIPLEQPRFTGSSHFYQNGSAWLAPVDVDAQWPENMVLFGEPSDEVDLNWEKLLGGRYVSISEEEAERAWGHKRHEYVDQELGGYTAGLDMFHILHCVNMLRKVLRPDFYQIGHLHGPEHTEHCLNLIRQSVQCAGSTNLIPSSFREGIEHNYVDSDQVHTCRSVSFLREWTNSRQPGQPAYVVRDMSLVDERKHNLAVEFASTHEESPTAISPLHN